MSKSIQLNTRNAETKSNMNKARKQGRIPAVLYGIGQDTLTVEVNEKEIMNILSTNPRAILQGKTPDEKAVSIVVQNIQKDVLSGKLLHIDFHIVNMSVSMDSKVAFHFSGESIGVKAGGMLQVELHEVEVRCMPGDLPSSIDVDISGLDNGQQLLVSDLVFKDGIEVLTPPDAVIVQVVTVEEEVEEPAVEAVEAEEVPLVTE
jgi:large subunit ribosomal protein L25